MEWQPIETAPKDGTWFLVWALANYEADVHVVRWADGKLLTSYADDWGDIEVTGTPTHWMPLPNAPTVFRGRQDPFMPHKPQIVWNR